MSDQRPSLRYDPRMIKPIAECIEVVKAVNVVQVRLKLSLDTAISCSSNKKVS